MWRQPYCARTPTTPQLTGGEETVMKPISVWGWLGDHVGQRPMGEFGQDAGVTPLLFFERHPGIFNDHRESGPQFNVSSEGRCFWQYMALFHCMVRHGTVRYGSLLGGFPLGTVPGTWYFFSTTSVEVPCEPYRYQNVTCKLCWSLIGLGKSSLLRHWTCHTRPSSTVIPARFKSAQLAKDRTQLLFKQTHIFASTTK